MTSITWSESPNTKTFWNLFSHTNYDYSNYYTLHKMQLLIYWFP